MTQIGNKIDWLLHARNISRKKFTEDIGFSDHTVQKIISNERPLNTQEIEKIATYFKMAPIELEYGEPKIVFENKDQTSITNQGNIYYQEAIHTIHLLEKQLDSLLQQNADDREEKLELKKEIKLLNLKIDLLTKK
jgi:transcriptional regulator with XRE-family HTH domain